MTRILVIGGTGFIGARVIARLLAAGMRPRIVDFAPNAARLRPGDAAACEFVTGDVTSADAVAAASEGCDGIVHLAGMLTVDCARDPARASAVNLTGSINVFEAAKQAKLPVAYLSSAGVFGPDSADTPFPMTIYGVTKLAVEGVARVYAADHGVPSLGLRPYIVYGPGESSGIAAGPSIAIAASLRREPATIRFSGRAGFVHVDDVARLLVAALSGGLAGSPVLTVAGQTCGVDEFVDELVRQTGWTGITVAGSPLKIPGDLASDPVPAWLGDHPVTPVNAGIAKTLDELRRQVPA
ncbi:NAD-dependent epimerase/dehydratase family protein [Pseudochelatococcus sp. B33]